MTAPQVLIVGAGPTGLVMALWLHRQGIPFRLIDRNSGPGTASRAMIVHARTLEFYRQLGIAEEVVASGVRVERLRLREHGDEIATFPVGDIGSGLSPYPFILTLPQDDHERLLTRHLEAEGVRVEWNTELIAFSDNGEKVAATLKTAEGSQECVVDYLCGCDGASSTVRRSLQLNFPGGTYDQRFFVADVVASGTSTDNSLEMCLGAASFGVTFPVRSTGMHRIIGIVPDEARDKEAPTFEDVRPVAEDLIGIKVLNVNWFSTYHVHHRVASHFQVGRVFIGGDAGHIHSPAGGQGMNTGIGDGVNLAWKLAQVLKGQASPRILETYEEERIVFARTLVKTTDRLFQMMIERSAGGRFLRTVIIPNLAPIALGFSNVKRSMFGAASQTRIAYHDSALSQGHLGHLRGGDRLPWVESLDNFAPLASMQWQIHVYGQANDALQRQAEALDLPLHAFGFDAETEEAALAQDAAYLIRPDGYIALILTDQDATALDVYVKASDLRFTASA
jgi:2-polyprenyl-6-methoxyphenol hydroxylase-like FAD-dependent oxidoreductase